MQFKYLRDPLFFLCVALYIANRICFRQCLPVEFLRSHLNDVICIPLWVPIMLYLMRICRLRMDDAPPSPGEILIPLVLWSIIFEIWLPSTCLFRGIAFADHLDVLSYTCGALAAGCFWGWYYRRHRQKLPLPE